MGRLETARGFRAASSLNQPRCRARGVPQSPRKRHGLEGLALVTATEYDLLSVLSANAAGRVSTYYHLLRPVWRSRRSGNPRLVRAFIKKLRRKLRNDAASPTYIFTEPRVGDRLWAREWALTRHDRLRRRVIIDAIAAHEFGLSLEDLRHVLEGCDLPKESL